MNSTISAKEKIDKIIKKRFTMLRENNLKRSNNTQSFIAALSKKYNRKKKSPAKP